MLLSPQKRRNEKNATVFIGTDSYWIPKNPNSMNVWILSIEIRFIVYDIQSVAKFLLSYHVNL